jgi:SAM-dependent methyltransferase
MDFYNQLSPYYHLIFPDWKASVLRQGEQLSTLMKSHWPMHQNILDVSCGIGTQALGLALQGHLVTGSDLSFSAVERAKEEATSFGVNLNLSVCDMRQAHRHHGSGFDVVISADNSLPHLLTQEDLLLAIRQMYACLNIGGGCILTLRDYDKEERGQNLVKPYGVRLENDKRFLMFQAWDFKGDYYDLSFFIIEESLSTHETRTHLMRSRYYAISTQKIEVLMREAGFQKVRRVDDAFYQPVLLGTKM